MALLTEFPIARSDSVMVVRDGQLMIWGGYTQTIIGEGDGRFIVAINLPDVDSDERELEICDLETMEWRKQETVGTCPVFGKGACSAVIGDHVYIFGGLDDEDYRNDLFRLHLEDFRWQQLSKINAPSERSYGGMVAYGECLLVFGGLGKKPHASSLKGAETIKNDKFGGEFIDEWNNSLHEYNTVTDTWREVGCSGSRPPPLERFSFDLIDNHRALLFSGKRGLFTAGFHDIYILDLDTMVWEGPIGPKSPDQIWPMARGVHGTACVMDPQSEEAALHQQMMVFWGEGNNAIHHSDIWILHVPTMTWKEVKVQADLVPRKYHMCGSYFRAERQTDVVVYGGNKRRKSKFERNVMTDMLIFRFGMVRSLRETCIRYIREHSHFEPHISSLPHSLQRQLRNKETKKDYTLFYPSEFL